VDQFLAEVLGKERRGNHGPRAGYHVSSVREQRAADELSGIAGVGHDEITNLARTGTGARRTRAAGA